MKGCSASCISTRGMHLVHFPPDHITARRAPRHSPESARCLGATHALWPPPRRASLVIRARSRTRLRNRTRDHHGHSKTGAKPAPRPRRHNISCCRGCGLALTAPSLKNTPPKNPPLHPLDFRESEALTQVFFLLSMLCCLHALRSQRLGWQVGQGLASPSMNTTKRRPNAIKCSLDRMNETTTHCMPSLS